jgi:hypothetical protein
MHSFHGLGSLQECCLTSPKPTQQPPEMIHLGLEGGLRQR